MIKGIESKKKNKPIGCFMGVTPLYPLTIHGNEQSENTPDIVTGKQIGRAHV